MTCKVQDKSNDSGVNCGLESTRDWNLRRNIITECVTSMNSMIKYVRYLASESPSNIIICYKGYVHGLESESLRYIISDCESKLIE